VRTLRSVVLAAIVVSTCGCIPVWGLTSPAPAPDQVTATVRALANAPDDFMLDLRLDSRGRLWYLDSPATAGVPSALVSVYDPRSATVRSATVPDGILNGLALGRDGTVWVAADEPWGLFRVDPTTFQVTDATSHLPAGAQPAMLATSADGALWFSDRTGAIGRLDPRSLAVQEYPLPPGSAKPAAIVVDRGVVDTVLDDGTLARLDVRTGVLHLIAAGDDQHYVTFDITALPDGTLWWAEPQAHEVVRFDPRTGRHDIVHLNGGRTPYSVALGPDGALWVTDTCVGIGMIRIDPRTLATADYLAGASGTVGMVLRRGHLWFLGGSAEGFALLELQGVGPATSLVRD
jgi:streptogramin lyase